MVVFTLAFLLGLKSKEDSEKSSPFECGFLPQINSRNPFSMHFFLIAIVFLIFDVELVLLFPFILGKETAVVGAEIFYMVLILLTLGTFLEWSQTMLDWTNFK